MAEIYNHVQVFPDLATSGVIPGACFSGLSEQGYQLVINLLPKESEHAVKDEPEQLARLGIEYVYIPVDFAAPSQQDFDAFAAAMDAGVIAKQPVEPLARLLLGAVTEAAVAVSAGPEIGKTGTDYARAFRSLLDALRVK